MELVKFQDITYEKLFNIINKINSNDYYLKDNINIIRKYIKDDVIKSDSASNILHMVLETSVYDFGKIQNLKRNKYYKSNCKGMIKALLKMGVNPNNVDEFGDNFLQKAVKMNFSIWIIEDLINYSKEYGLDINHVNNKGETFLHTFIYSGNYLCEGSRIENIIDEVIDGNFNMEIRDNNNVKVTEAMQYYNTLSNKMGKYSKEQLAYFGDGVSYEKKVPYKKLTATRYRSSINEEYGEMLESEIEQTEAITELNDYINKLLNLLACSRKSLVIESDNLFGSNLLLNELIYRIDNDLVPEVFGNISILRVNFSYLIYQFFDYEEFENYATDFIETVINNDIILLIDNIDMLYSLNIPYTNNILSVLVRYIRDGKIKVIGTTTKKDLIDDNCYNKLSFSIDNNELLYVVAKYIYMNYANLNDIYLEDEADIQYAISSILTLGEEAINDTGEVLLNVCDVEEIIDNAFVVAKMKNSEYLTIDNVMEGIKNYKSKGKSLVKKNLF